MKIYSNRVIRLIILLCFFNTSLYYISILTVDKYEEKLNRYPIVKRLLNYYSKLRMTHIVSELILGIVCCLIIIISCLAILGIIVWI